jgi:hypothetical protein
MARKKRTVEEAAVVSDVPKLPALTQEELFRLRFLSAEERLAGQEARSVRLEREVYLSRIDPQRQLAAMEAKLQECSKREAEMRREYAEALKKAADRLGFDLSNGVTVNVETGEVTRHQK